MAGKVLCVGSGHSLLLTRESYTVTQWTFLVQMSQNQYSRKKQNDRITAINFSTPIATVDVSVNLKQFYIHRSRSDFEDNVNDNIVVLIANIVV